MSNSSGGLRDAGPPSHDLHIGCILLGGDIYAIQETPHTKTYWFEWHPMWGPSRVRADTKEITKNPFYPERSAFWPLFERWQANGMKVDAHGRCQIGRRDTSGVGGLSDQEKP